jgi:hypothetical protein
VCHNSKMCVSDTVTCPVNRAETYGTYWKGCTPKCIVQRSAALIGCSGLATCKLLYMTCHVNSANIACSAMSAPSLRYYSVSLHHSVAFGPRKGTLATSMSSSEPVFCFCLLQKVTCSALSAGSH